MRRLLCLVVAAVCLTATAPAAASTVAVAPAPVTRATTATAAPLAVYGTQQVSRSSAGAASDQDSQIHSLSGNGRWVAYTSAATTLTPGPHNYFQDVFLTDRRTGATRLVSRGSDGRPTDRPSYHGSLSDDGRYLAYYSSATNIGPDSDDTLDVFVWDRLTETTKLLSRGPGGVRSNGDSTVPALSGNGDWVAYTSRATNLAAGPEAAEANGHVYVTRVSSGETVRVSPEIGDGWTFAGASFPAISDDGRWITYFAVHHKQVNGRTVEDCDIFLVDRVGGTTRRIWSVPVLSPHGTHWTNPTISGDGRWVAFHTRNRNYLPGMNDEGTFLVDTRSAAAPRRIAPAGLSPVSAKYTFPTSISDDGRYLALQRPEGLAVYDTHSGAYAEGPSSGPADLSDNGRTVSFLSGDEGLVRDDANRRVDVFVSSVAKSGLYSSGIRLTDLEVTQVVQDLANSVPLVIGKTTVVRAHLRKPAGVTGTVTTTGKLRGYRGGKELPDSPIDPINAGGHVRVTQDYGDVFSAPSLAARAQRDSSLNFVLPRTWRTGRVALRLELPGGVDCGPMSGGDCPIEVAFQRGMHLNTEYRNVTWPGKAGMSLSLLDLRKQAQRVLDQMPASDWAGRVDGPAIHVGQAPELKLRNVLEAVGAVRRAEVKSASWKLFGVIGGKVPAGGTGGVATAIPGSYGTSYDFDARGETDTREGRNVVVHEVAHMYGAHTRSTQTGSAIPRAGRHGDPVASRRARAHRPTTTTRRSAGTSCRHSAPAS
jgi:Tol biopolymer transport system component